MDTWDMIATERRRLADELEQLTPEQWAQATACDAWDVRHVAVHLVSPFGLGFGGFLAGMIGAGFSLDRFAINRTRRFAERLSNEDVIATLRREADNRWTPPAPGLGAEIPLSEIVVHGQDIRRALDLPCTVPEATIEHCLAGVKSEKEREDYRRRIG